MRKILIILLFLVIQCSSGREKISKDKYFLGIVFRESPFAPFKGVTELTKEQALKSFHYKFEYDSNQKLLRISQRIGENTVHHNVDYNAFFINSSILDFSYLKDTLLISYKNRFGELFSTEEGVRFEKFIFDKNGTLKKMIYLDSLKNPSNNKWGISTYKWEKENDFIKETRFNTVGDPMPMRPDLMFYNVKLYYDKNGLIKKFTNNSQEWELANSENGMAYDRITYNKQSNFVKWETFDENGIPVFNLSNGIASGKNYDDKFGKIFKTEYFNLSGNPVESNYGYASFKTIYDNQNNIIGWFLYDKEGKLKADSGSKPIIGINEFDSLKRRIGYHFVDENLTKINHPDYQFSTIRFSYDGKDRLIIEEYLNIDGNLVFFEPRGAARIRYFPQVSNKPDEHFDENGIKIK